MIKLQVKMVEDNPDTAFDLIFLARPLILLSFSI